jgi:hypothetical protein
MRIIKEHSFKRGLKDVYEVRQGAMSRNSFIENERLLANEQRTLDDSASERKKCGQSRHLISVGSIPRPLGRRLAESQQIEERG